MHKHDNDNIPVLDDVIHEYELLQPDETATDQKQKTLWDDDSDEIAEAPAAFAAPEEPARTEADAAPGSDDAAAETADHTDAIAAGEAAALLRDHAPGNITGIAYVAADAGYDDIPAGPDEAAYDEFVDTATPPADSETLPVAEHIDIDELADRILLQLMPGLEDYLLDRIRSALQTALVRKPRD